MTLTRLLPATLIGMALLAGPAFAADPTAEDLKKLTDRLEKAVKDLQDAKDGIKIDGVREKTTVIDTKLDMMDKDIQDIKKDLRDLRRRLDGGTSTSLRPDDAALLRTQARVRIINTHWMEMSVVINGRSYRVAPGEREIRIPAGEYRLEVLQIPGERKSGDLAAGETKTFTIFPTP